jgi:hypothetical protein
LGGEEVIGMDMGYCRFVKYLLLAADFGLDLAVGVCVLKVYLKPSWDSLFSLLEYNSLGSPVVSNCFPKVILGSGSSVGPLPLKISMYFS